MSPPPASISADFSPFAPTTSAPRAAASPAALPATDNALVPIGLVLASTVFFSAGDIAAKFLTGSVPGIEVAWLRYRVFCLMIIPTIFTLRGRSRPVLVRRERATSSTITAQQARHVINNQSIERWGRCSR
jgi:hypothetical protein